MIKWERILILSYFFMSETLDIQTNNQKSEIAGLSPEKEALLKQKENFSTFSQIMKSALISSEEKQKVLLIINNSDKVILEDYFDYNWFNLVDEKWIKDFINNPDFLSILKDLTIQQKDLTIQQKDLTIQQKDLTIQQENKNSYLNFKETYNKENKLKLTKAIWIINNVEFSWYFTKLNELDWKLEQLEKLFKDKEKENNPEFIKLFWEQIKKEHDIIFEKIATYLSKDQNAIKVFQKLQNDPESYKALYTFLQSSGNTEIAQILQIIPQNPESLKVWTKRAQEILDKSPYFPDSDSKDIKTTWHIIEARLDENTSKIVDTSEIPPRTFISWINWYHIETRTVSGEILNIRAAFTLEKIRIGGKLQTNSKQILDYNQILQGKDTNTITKEIEKLKNKPEKTLEEETKLAELEQELKTIQEIEDKIKKLQSENQLLQKELEQKENEFLKYYSLSLLKEKEQTRLQDTQAKETIQFLDNLWLTNISQDDLQKIINLVNINPQNFWLSKKIDLEKWFTNEWLEKNKFKNEFIELFSKLYKEIWIKVNPVRVIDWNWYALVDSENNPVENKTIKQSLESNWITRWWSLNIIKTMQILSQKPEDKEKIKQN